MAIAGGQDGRLMLSDSFSMTGGASKATASFAQRLVWARAGTVGLYTLLLAAVHKSGGEAASLLLALTGGIAVAAAASLLALLHLRRVAKLTDAAMFRNVLADLAVLTYMLAVSGGADNPFHDAYFLPVAVAASTMAPAFAWRVAAASLVCYSLVHFAYVPLPGSAEVLARTDVAGEWLTNAALTVLCTYFLSRILCNARLCERQLAEAHASAARAECAVAVGSIAAGAAHELSTPMMTIAAGLAELRAKYRDDPDLRQRLDLIDGGVAECCKTLAVLRQAQGPSFAPGRSLAVHEFVDGVLARLHAMQPASSVRSVVSGHGAEPLIGADLALQQAVINLLVNAVQASTAEVELTTTWTEDEIVFRVADTGPGVSPDVLERLGLSFVTTKPNGTGMGLFLTRVTTHRLGGSFNIRNAPGGGAVAEILLPLALIAPRRT